MGFRIDLTNALAHKGKVMFDDTDVSSGVQSVEIIARAGDLVYANLKISIEKLNGVDFGPKSNTQLTRRP